MFVFGAIITACDGDFSGLAVIGKIILWIVVVVISFFLMLHPMLLVIVGILSFVIYAVVSTNN